MYGAASTWQPTGCECIRKILDQHTSLVRTCYIIDGQRVTVTQNFPARGCRIAN